MYVRRMLCGAILSTLAVTVGLPATAQGAVVPGPTTVCSNPPKPTIRISDAWQFEGAFALLTVSLSNSFCTNVTVRFTTVDGGPFPPAVAPGDYQPSSGTLVFTPGQVSRTIPVWVKCDNIVEPVEHFHVRLSAPVNGTIVDGVGVVRVYNRVCQTSPTH